MLIDTDGKIQIPIQINLDVLGKHHNAISAQLDNSQVPLPPLVYHYSNCSVYMDFIARKCEFRMFPKHFRVEYE